LINRKRRQRRLPRADRIERWLRTHPKVIELSTKLLGWLTASATLKAIAAQLFLQ
jgi:hypothetical protein